MCLNFASGSCCVWSHLLLPLLCITSMCLLSVRLCANSSVITVDIETRSRWTHLLALGAFYFCFCRTWILCAHVCVLMPLFFMYMFSHYTHTPTSETIGSVWLCDVSCAREIMNSTPREQTRQGAQATAYWQDSIQSDVPFDDGAYYMPVCSNIY